MSTSDTNSTQSASNSSSDSSSWIVFQERETDNIQDEIRDEQISAQDTQQLNDLIQNIDNQQGTANSGSGMLNILNSAPTSPINLPSNQAPPTTNSQRKMNNRLNGV